MPYSTHKATPDSSLNYLINAVQYAHLLREIRRKPSMGIVFHLANYKHWKDMSTERIFLPTELDLRDLMTQALSSISCKIVLQMLRISNNDRSSGIAHLLATADVELITLLNIFQRRSEAQDSVLTALDGYDVFSVGVYLVDQQMQNANSGRFESAQLLRDCLDLLSNISQRFGGIKDLRNALWAKMEYCEGLGQPSHQWGGST